MTASERNNGEVTSYAERQFRLDVAALVGAMKLGIGALEATKLIKETPGVHDGWRNPKYTQRLARATIREQEALASSEVGASTSSSSNQKYTSSDDQGFSADTTPTVSEPPQPEVIDTPKGDVDQSQSVNAPGIDKSNNVKKKEVLSRADIAGLIYTYLKKQGIDVVNASSLDGVQGPLIKHLNSIIKDTNKHIIDINFCTSAGLNFWKNTKNGVWPYEKERLYFWLGLRSHRTPWREYEIHQVDPMDLGAIVKSAERGHQQVGSATEQSLLSALKKTIDHLSALEEVGRG